MKPMLAACLAVAVSPAFGECECQDGRILDQYVRGICLSAITDVTSNCKEDILEEIEKLNDKTDEILRLNKRMIDALLGAGYER